MKINQAGIDLIRSFEGCKLTAYRDQKGIWTIGYGHTQGVVAGMVITQDEAERLFLADLAKFEHGVGNLLDVHVTDNQFAALVSFAYNLGLGDLATSGLLKMVNAREFEAAAAQFKRWDHCGGVEDKGLLRRRLAERDLFLLG